MICTLGVWSLCTNKNINLQTFINQRMCSASSPIALRLIIFKKKNAGTKDVMNNSLVGAFRQQYRFTREKRITDTHTEKKSQVGLEVL